jgi:hypothetical protein
VSDLTGSECCWRSHDFFSALLFFFSIVCKWCWFVFGLTFELEASFYCYI